MSLLINFSELRIWLSLKLGKDKGSSKKLKEKSLPFQEGRRIVC